MAGKKVVPTLEGLAYEIFYSKPQVDGHTIEVSIQVIPGGEWWYAYAGKVVSDEGFWTTVTLSKRTNSQRVAQEILEEIPLFLSGIT